MCVEIRAESVEPGQNLLRKYTFVGIFLVVDF